MSDSVGSTLLSGLAGTGLLVFPGSAGGDGEGSVVGVSLGVAELVEWTVTEEVGVDVLGVGAGVTVAVGDTVSGKGVATGTGVDEEAGTEEKGTNPFPGVRVYGGSENAWSPSMQEEACGLKASTCVGTDTNGEHGL